MGAFTLNQKEGKYVKEFELGDWNRDQLLIIIASSYAMNDASCFLAFSDLS